MRRRGARSRSPRRLRARRSAALTRAEERGMTTRRGKCGGRARRRLGTPSAAGSGCSPRLHKPSWADGSTLSRAVPQPPAAPPDLGASGRRGPRAVVLHRRPDLSGPFLRASPSTPFLSFSSASLQRALQPAAKFSHDPGKDIQETVRKSPRVRSDARPPSQAGKLRGQVRSSRGGG